MSIPTLRAESTDLEVHVEQCAARYSEIRRTFDAVQDDLKKVRQRQWLVIGSIVMAGTGGMERVAEFLAIMVKHI